MTFAWLAFFDAILAIAMIAAGMIGAHFRLIAPFMGFQLFALGFLLSLLGFLVGLLAIFLTRKPQARPGAIVHCWATVVCVVIALPVIVTVLGSAKYPPINDITTDFDNPPEFVNAQKLQHEPNRDMKYDKAKYADRAACRVTARSVQSRSASDPAALSRASPRSPRPPDLDDYLLRSGHEYARSGRDFKAVAFQ